MFLREKCLETNIKAKIQEHETFIVSYSCKVLKISGLREKR